MLHAAATLVQRNFDFDMLICGAGPEREKLAREASKFGIASRIEWHGSVPHIKVPDVMARLDVLVLPSVQITTWAEQFGLVLAQAMAMGMVNAVVPHAELEAVADHMSRLPPPAP